MKIRTYSELCQMETYEERLGYLRLAGQVGTETFGFDRVFNQKFYNSAEWKRIRNQIIARDYGGDMGLADYPIRGKILVHHMNPLVLQDIQDSTENLFNPDFLICVSHETHNAIHYGTSITNSKTLIVRTPFDTCPWKKSHEE